MEIEKDIKRQYDPFHKLPLKPDLISCLKKCGFLKPYDIQEKALIPMIQGRDVFIQSSCASGKTSLSIITALQLIDPAAKEPQALILSPRRLEAQRAKEIAMEIGQKMDLKAALLVGGVKINEQKKTLRKGASLILGTPGRVLDVLEEDELSLKKLRLIIVEDCDEVLGLGFGEIMKKLLKFVSPGVQMCIFAGNCSNNVRSFIEFCLRNPVYISKYPPLKQMKDLEHFSFPVEKEEDKVDFLIKLYSKMNQIRKAIVYCKKMEDIERLVRILREKNLNVTSIDYSMSQVERCQSILRFMEEISDQILVTIDPQFFFGIDCEQKTEVLFIINYDVPESGEEYEKYAQKAFLFTKKQVMINMKGPGDSEKIKKIELFCGIRMIEEEHYLSKV